MGTTTSTVDMSAEAEHQGENEENRLPQQVKEGQENDEAAVDTLNDNEKDTTDDCATAPASEEAQDMNITTGESLTQEEKKEEASQEKVESNEAAVNTINDNAMDANDECATAPEEPEGLKNTIITNMESPSPEEKNEDATQEKEKKDSESAVLVSPEGAKYVEEQKWTFTTSEKPQEEASAEAAASNDGKVETGNNNTDNMDVVPQDDKPVSHEKAERAAAPEEGSEHPHPPPYYPQYGPYPPPSAGPYYPYPPPMHSWGGPSQPPPYYPHYPPPPPHMRMAYYPPHPPACPPPPPPHGHHPYGPPSPYPVFSPPPQRDPHHHPAPPVHHGERNDKENSENHGGVSKSDSVSEAATQDSATMEASHVQVYLKSAIPTTPDIIERRKRKNAQSRMRAEKLRLRVQQIAVKPEHERTEEESLILQRFNQRRSKKNERSKERAQEKNSTLSSILAKPESKRTKMEKAFLERNMSAKQRKNEGDRLRRQRLKQLGILNKSSGPGGSKPGISARGPLPPEYQHLETPPRGGGTTGGESFGAPPPPHYPYMVSPPSFPPYGAPPPHSTQEQVDYGVWGESQAYQQYPPPPPPADDAAAITTEMEEKSI